MTSTLMIRHKPRSGRKERERGEKSKERKGENERLLNRLKLFPLHYLRVPTELHIGLCV